MSAMCATYSIQPQQMVDDMKHGPILPDKSIKWATFYYIEIRGRMRYAFKPKKWPKCNVFPSSGEAKTRKNVPTERRLQRDPPGVPLPPPPLQGGWGEGSF